MYIPIFTYIFFHIKKGDLNNVSNLRIDNIAYSVVGSTIVIAIYFRRHIRESAAIAIYLCC